MVGGVSSCQSNTRQPITGGTPHFGAKCQSCSHFYSMKYRYHLYSRWTRVLMGQAGILVPSILFWVMYEWQVFKTNTIIQLDHICFLVRLGTWLRVDNVSWFFADGVANKLLLIIRVLLQRCCVLRVLPAFRQQPVARAAGIAAGCQIGSDQSHRLARHAYCRFLWEHYRVRLKSNKVE